MSRRHHTGVPRVPVAQVAAGPLVLTDATAHYLRNVLRLAAGDALVLFDAGGGEATAAVVEAVAGRVQLRVETPRRPAAPVGRLTVAMATPKGERADWAVEKLTEVGVGRIIWLVCARSVVQPRKQGSRQQRWQRLAQSAARQCGRPDVPPIEGPLPFALLLGAGDGRRLIADCDGTPLAQLLARTQGGAEPGVTTLAIGPEGGFTSDELAQALAAGYTATRLGPWTLRVETAAVIAAAQVLGTIDAQRSPPGVVRTDREHR